MENHLVPRGIWARPSDLDKLLARCTRDKATGCLNCSGFAYRGYPRAMVGGKQMRANRAAWILHKGPIPAGQQVLHKCDNRRCVEEEHLFLGTNRDNMDDKIAKGRQLHGEKVPGASLTADDALAIYRDPRDKHVLGLLYGVHSATIHLIKIGKNWRRVTQRAA